MPLCTAKGDGDRVYGKKKKAIAEECSEFFALKQAQLSIS